MTADLPLQSLMLKLAPFLRESEELHTLAIRLRLCCKLNSLHVTAVRGQRHPPPARPAPRPLGQTGKWKTGQVTVCLSLGQSNWTQREDWTLDSSLGPTLR